MNNFINMKTKILKALESSKNFIQKTLEWRKNDVWAWLLKSAILAAGIVLMILFFVYVFPALVVLALFYFLCKWEKNQTPPFPYQNIALAETARNLIYEVIYENGDILEMEKPHTVNDITPTKYPVTQTVNGCPFYRFIVRHKPEHEDNFPQMKDALNIVIQQKLSAGFPNIAVPFYRDISAFVVTKLGLDRYHSGYFYIDIMPIMDDKAYGYVQTMYQRELALAEPIDIFAPNDEDF